ncbi:MAG: hypothetical protein U0L77_07075 [Prevotellamassilia sp.]|nr:hypothetical protein [Prevotellamassilia sp.]
MRKISTLLVMLCAFIGAWAQYYIPGARTTTLEAGKKYFISAATFYGNARPNLLYNKAGNLAYSESKPAGAMISNDAYLFTVEEVGEGNVYYIKNSDGYYLQSNTLESSGTKTGITVVPYNSVKGSISCGNDVQACDENGNKIDYDAITNETPIVCVYQDENKGWRHISGLQIGKSTPFAFYEVKTQSGLVELTENTENPVYYAIKNVRTGKYATYAGDEKQLKQIPGVSPDGLFYFTAGTATADGQTVVKIHNYSAEAKLCAGPNSWTETGIDWFLKPQATGVSIANSADASGDDTSWNDAGGNGVSIAYWNGPDAGSAWEIEKFEGEIPAFKTSTPENIVLCQMNPVRQSTLVNFVGHNQQMTQVKSSELGTYWYFMVDEAEQATAPEGVTACKIFSPLHETGLENHDSGFMGTAQRPAKVYYIKTLEQGGRKGYAIYPKGSTKGLHDNGGATVVNWDVENEGSVWNIYSTEKTLDDIKAELQTSINKLGAAAYVNAYVEADYYSVADDVKAAAKAKVAVEQGAETYELYAAYVSYKQAKELIASAEKGTAAPAVGEYIQLKNRNYNKYLKATDTGLTSVENRFDLSTVWVVEEGTDGNVKLKNFLTQKYIGEIRQSANVAMVESANAKQFAITNQVDCYAVFKETTGGAYAFGHIAGHNVLVGWEAPAGASQWVISQLDGDEAIQVLQGAYDAANASFGAAVGMYKETDAYVAEKAKVEDVLADTEGEKNVGEILGLVADFGEVVAQSEKVAMVPGYYYVQKANDKMAGKYITVDGIKMMATAATAGINEIWKFETTDGGYKIKHANLDKYVVLENASANGGEATSVNSADGGVFTLTDNGNGKQVVATDGHHMRIGNNGKVNYWDTEKNVTWYLIPATELDVTVTEAGYATLNLPFDVTLPNTVKAYAVETVEGGYASLVDKTDIPANQGAILEGAGTHTLTIAAASSDWTNNKLVGTNVNTYVAGEAYVLGKDGEGAGFFKAALNKNEAGEEGTTHFLNNANKAYLPATAGASLVLRFNFGGTTAIESVVNGIDANAAIYDLSGRRVEKAVKGIYIQNGKKIIVK